MAIKIELLRCSGRLDNAGLAESGRQPIRLPQKRQIYTDDDGKDT